MGDADHRLTDRYRTQARRTASQRLTPTIAGQDASVPQDGITTGEPLHLDGVTETKDEPSISNAATYPSAASPAIKSEDEGIGNPAIEPPAQEPKPKTPMTTRMKAGSKRFVGHFKNAIFHSWINVLLIFVPVGIAAEVAKLNPAVVFGLNAIAIIPLAGLLTHATEAVASRLGDTLGALLNVSFGNAVELIIFIIALVKNEIRIVQASLLGSILANLLLILGMAFLLGGLRYREQIYNSTVTQMSACLLSLSVMSLLLPTAFHASFNSASTHAADTQVLKVSRGTSVILLFVYFLYLLFQLKSHAYMYESTPQAVIDEESHPGVLADMMNSSSSDSSSSDSSSDSDTSGSGSVATTTKKMKRMFTHKKRRTSSTRNSLNGNGLSKLSSLSSPSTQERDDPMESVITSQGPSTRGAAILSDDADADGEDNGASRNFDWATHRQLSNDGSKSPEPRKRHKKHSKKKEKKRRREAAEAEKAEAANRNNTKVEFADEVTVLPSQELAEDTVGQSSSPKLPFNMRQISSRARPGLSKMLSNNVFVQPAPHGPPPSRPSAPRSQSSGNLRRANSLPDRLNRQTPAGDGVLQSRTDPLPPFQHQRFPLRKVTSGMSAGSDEDGEEVMSRTAATVLLLCSTALVAVCAEFMVDAIPAMIGDGNTVSEAFIGLIILPIVGNAAEHVTAVTVAMKNKMDLAIGVAVGSSIQIALFVTPVVVLLGWILNTSMSLYFNLFETISLFVTAFVVNFLVLDGRSNYLEGALLIAAYVIIALVSFFYPDAAAQSSVGGGAGVGN